MDPSDASIESAGDSSAVLERVARSGPGVGFGTDLVTALLCVWFTLGLFLDAWAHNNLPGLETFFTPWHAVFYSGFASR
jgi:hypothetical protein